MLLDGLHVVLVKTRFPENIGMTARACANMGCPSLHLVAPERWAPARAAPLATSQGQAILDEVRVHDSLAEALRASQLAIGTTARTGGWRAALVTPAQAAASVADALGKGEEVSLVFGPEDRGLENTEVSLCQRLVTIPTATKASSLNLAQAVLLLLYECANAVRVPTGEKGSPSRREALGRTITVEEQERLMEAFRAMLFSLDLLHGDNPEYFLLPWRRLFGRARLRRHEYDALMGLCRQVRNRLP